jgi:SulP family sulfate permease
LGVTFFGTLFLELEFAIYVGMIFSLMFYLQRTSKPNVAIMAPDPDSPTRQFTYIIRKEGLQQCPQLKILRIDGSLYYGAIDHIQGEIAAICDSCDAANMLIVAQGINFIDLAGAEWLVQESEKLKAKGGKLYVVGLKRIAQDILVQGGFKEAIGNDNFFVSKRDALKVIYENMDSSICATCTKRIFKECNS